MLPGKINCNSCGWKAKGVSEAIGGRPVLSELRAVVAQVLRTTSSDHPIHRMPKDENAAVDWFLRLIEPEHRTERPQEIRTKTGAYWRWPYADRVVYMLRGYLAASESLQRLVVAAREDAIYWRGDDEPFFIGVINETEKMRAMGLDEYRRDARNAMSRVNLQADR